MAGVYHQEVAGFDVILTEAAFQEQGRILRAGLLTSPAREIPFGSAQGRLSPRW